MLVGNFDNIGWLEKLNPRMAEIVRFVDTVRKGEFEAGKKEYPEMGIRINSDEVTLGDQSEKKFEAHKRFIDIHVPIDNDEIIGWEDINDMCSPIEPGYIESKDVVKFIMDTDNLTTLKPGQFAICYPEDAHKPNIGSGSHRKLCVKIPV